MSATHTSAAIQDHLGR